MKTMIYIVLFLAIIAYVGEMHISFSPFAVSFPKWRMMLAVIFLMLGLSFYGLQQFHDGQRKGFLDQDRLIRETLDEIEARDKKAE